MPLYSYQCKSCGTIFDRIRGIDNDDDEIECPKCGKTNPQRLLSSFSTKTTNFSVGST